MSRDNMIDHMEKLLKKISLYEKKREKMGLDKEEIKLYNKLYVEYLGYKVNLCDDVFNEYIMPNIVYGKAEKLLTKISKTIKWHGDLLVFEDKIGPVIKSYSNNKSKLLDDMILELYDLLRDNLADYLHKYNDCELFREICLLLSNGDNPNNKIIENFLDYKFYILFDVLTEKC